MSLGEVTSRTKAFGERLLLERKSFGGYIIGKKLLGRDCILGEKILERARIEGVWGKFIFQERQSLGRGFKF